MEKLDIDGDDDVVVVVGVRYVKGEDMGYGDKVGKKEDKKGKEGKKVAHIWGD